MDSGSEKSSVELIKHFYPFCFKVSYHCSQMGEIRELWILKPIFNILFSLFEMKRWNKLKISNLNGLLELTNHSCDSSLGFEVAKETFDCNLLKMVENVCCHFTLFRV